MELEQILHCMPCPPTLDPKTALASLTLLATNVGTEHTGKLDEIARVFRQVVRDNRKLQDEVDELKKQVKPKKEKPVKIRCPFITAKGTQCSKFCVEGSQTCKVHSKPLKPPKPVKPPRTKKQMCTGINIRGNPCRNKCVEGETFCERHDPATPVPQKRTKRSKKRPIQMHNHGPNEVPKEKCLLCETHGNMFDPNIVNHTILETPGPSGYTLRDRIRILKSKHGTNENASLYDATARVIGK